MTRLLRLFIALQVVLGAACGDDDATPDSATDDSSQACACNDGLFCNGEERCDADDPDADEDGCVAGEPPCADGMCDESADICPEACDNPDIDGDGVDGMACGGTDCDDNDPDRYPGNTEVCDANNVDEDCDSTTFGDRDADGDGEVDAQCCNGSLCGQDCDDSLTTSNTTAPEVCDGVDNDCDGELDEGVQETYYRDVDGDNFGDPSMSMLNCTAPNGWVLSASADCDDRNAAVNPAADEQCDGTVDDNCNGTVDEDCACTESESRDCGPAEAGTGTCRLGTQTCTGGLWPSACAGAVVPRTNDDGELWDPCGGGDEDCDGSTDEDGRIAFYADTDSDGYGDPSSSIMACPGDEGSGYVANDDDCDDTNSAIKPTAVEECDGVDNNCSGSIDDRSGGCNCTQGQMRTCGTDVGACSEGIETCNASGSWGACIGATSGVPESSLTCNARDDDCDGRTDEGLGVDAPTDATTIYRDRDGDGYGSSSSGVSEACSVPDGWASNNSDCVDVGYRAEHIHPGADYHTVGHCRGGTPCDNGGEDRCTICGGTPPFVFCQCTGALSFDYDCSNTTQVQPATTCTGRPPPQLGCQPAGAAPTSSHSSSSCGTNVQYGTCCYDCSGAVCSCARGCNLQQAPLACR